MLRGRKKENHTHIPPTLPRTLPYTREMTADVKNRENKVSGLSLSQWKILLVPEHAELLVWFFRHYNIQKEAELGRGVGGELKRGCCSSCLVLFLPRIANDTDVLKQKPSQLSFDWLLPTSFYFYFLYLFWNQTDKFTLLSLQASSY